MIRKKSMKSASSSPPSPASSITSHSFASSTDSSVSVVLVPPPSNSYSLSPSFPTRCEGLNLLVKAIHQVTAGSVVGVPYIQRRVIIRRRRALRFNKLMVTELFEKVAGKEEDGETKKSKLNRRRRRRAMARPRHRSIDVGE